MCINERSMQDTAAAIHASLPLSRKTGTNARIPAKVLHQLKQIILLTCDAFGILPPISKLTPDQVLYQSISGYTAKVLTDTLLR